MLCYYAKPLGQSKPIYMWNHPRVRGTKVYLGYLGPMTKMTDTPIYGESPSKIFSRTKRPMTLKPGMKHWVLGSIITCLNNDPVMTLTYFMLRSKLVAYVCIWRNL